jgi:hypothetical protein
MYRVLIETADNGFIVRVTKDNRYDLEEVRVYPKLSDAMKYLKSLLDSEMEPAQ